MYVEIDGKPCCLEMASRIDGDFMPDGYSRDEILSSVRIHKEKVYIDPVTGVYNKRYYVEKLSKMDRLMFQHANLGSARWQVCLTKLGYCRGGSVSGGIHLVSW